MYIQKANPSDVTSIPRVLTAILKGLEPMANSNIASPTVLAHKKNAKWTEDEILQAFDELGVTLDEPFSGSIGDKHWVTFSNGDRSHVKIGGVLCGNTKGKSRRWSEEDIILFLSERGFTLKQPFTRTNDYHLVEYPTGKVKSVRLNYILDGRIKGVKGYTTEHINKLISKYGAVLSEEFKGSVNDRHLVTFSNGATKNVLLASVISGDSVGKFHTEATVIEELAKVNIVLAEDFKGSTRQKHLVTFSNGVTKNVTLESAMRGQTTGKQLCQQTTESINSRLVQYGAVLIEPYKGYTKEKHKILFKCGHVHETTVKSALIGIGCPACAGRGFNPKRPGYLYFIEVSHEEKFVYKVGITNNSVEDRYKTEGAKYKTLSLFQHATGYIVRRAEKDILKTFKEWSYSGTSPFNKTGTSEMFVLDISLDYRFTDIVLNHGLETIPKSLIAN